MGKFNKFEKDMDIISALPDEPNDIGGLTADELKRKFDEGGNAIKEYINEELLSGLEDLALVAQKGAHVILDKNGAEMKQRPNLMFDGTVTDNGTYATVVKFTASDVGAIGLKRELTTSDDLNNIKEDGVYYYTTATATGGLKNVPFDAAAVIMVFGAANTTSQKIQIAFRYGEPGYFKSRALLSGSWLAWKQYATTDDLTLDKLGAAPAGYGLGKAQKITWDTINKQEPGWYYIAGENTICGHTARYWYMHVASYAGGTAYCTQTLYSVNGDKTFERRQNDGVWSEWVDVSPSSYSKYDLLWENASRTSSFAAQTITVDTTAYNFLAVEVAYNEKEMNGSEIRFVGMRKKGYGDTAATLAAHLITSSGAFNTVSRKLTIKSARGSIVVDGGIGNGGGASDTNAIPVKIYGIRGI